MHAFRFFGPASRHFINTAHSCKQPEMPGRVLDDSGDIIVGATMLRQSNTFTAFATIFNLL